MIELLGKCLIANSHFMSRYAIVGDTFLISIPIASSHAPLKNEVVNSPMIGLLWPTLPKSSIVEGNKD